MRISLRTTVTFYSWLHQTFVWSSGLDENKQTKPSKALPGRTQISQKNSKWIWYFLKANRNLQTTSG